MRKLISKALLSLVMDKGARDALERRSAAKKAPAEEGSRAGGGRVRRPPQVPSRKEKPISTSGTAERKELIRQALDVRRAKAQLLEGLGEQDKHRLRAVALTAFLLGTGPDKGG